jgi:hypothetical protein
MRRYGFFPCLSAPRSFFFIASDVIIKSARFTPSKHCCIFTRLRKRERERERTRVERERDREREREIEKERERKREKERDTERERKRESEREREEEEEVQRSRKQERERRRPAIADRSLLYTVELGGSREDCMLYCAQDFRGCVRRKSEIVVTLFLSASAVDGRVLRSTSGNSLPICK